MNSVSFLDGDMLSMRYNETGNTNTRVRFTILYQALPESWWAGAPRANTRRALCPCTRGSAPREPRRFRTKSAGANPPPQRAMPLPSLKPYRRVADPADETRRGFRLRRRRWRAARASWVGKALALRKNAVDTALTGTVGRNRTTHVCCARGFIFE